MAMGARDLAEVKIHNYEHEVFERLNQFHVAKRFLQESYEEIETIGKVIVNNDLNERLGVSLLHKHFPLYCDERLVRHFQRDGRVMTMEPRRNDHKVVPYLWRVSFIRDRCNFFPLEFVELETSGIEEFTLADFPEFCLQVAGAMASSETLNVFGLATPNILLLQPEEDEILLETTDSERRQLTVVPIKRHDVRLEDVTETFWMFSPETDCGHPECVAKCKGSHCKSHCSAHCSTHCKTHCKVHCDTHCYHSPPKA